MDETPIVPVPDPVPASPRRSANLGLQRALLVALGAIVGAALVLAGLYFARRPERVVYRERPVPSATTPAAATPGPTPADKAASPGPTGPDAPPATTPDKAPSNPPKAAPPKGMAGQIGSAPLVVDPGSLPDHAPLVVSPEHDDPAPRGLLLTIRLEVSDPDSAFGALQALAAKNGGTAIRFDENATKSETEGAILLVPAASAESARKGLASIGTVVVSDSWTGPSATRLDRIEADAEARLRELRIQRQELLVRYFEDAPQVRHVDEDAGRISKSLAALHARKPEASTAIIKIRF